MTTQTSLHENEHMLLRVLFNANRWNDSPAYIKILSRILIIVSEEELRTKYQLI